MNRLRCWPIALTLVALCWGPLAFAGAMPTFSATTSGSAGSLNITATIAVADADAGKSGNFYLVANFNGGWYAHDGIAWVAWRGGAVPVYAAGALTNRSIEIAHALDSSALAGAQVFVGYGLDESDMLTHGKYGLVHVLPPAVSVVRSPLQRVSAPNVAQADKLALVADNSAFAVDLYRQLQGDAAQSGRNIFFSPLSISVALAMTYAGALGPTASEMATALHYSLPTAQLHPAFGWLDVELMGRGQGALGKDGQPFRLRVSNSLWGDSQSSFAEPFLNTLAQYYGAGMNLVSFRSAAEPSRVRINDWVADQTEQRIKDLIPQGSLSALTRLVLVNAVYFNAAWQSKFLKQATTSAPFTRLDGSTQQVELMSQDTWLPYASNTEYQAVEIPYDGGELGMLVVLPSAGNFVRFEQSFDATSLNAMRAALANRYVRLGLPRFKLEGSFSLKAAMQALGMRTAFTDRADFSAISASETLRIEDIFHKGYAEVDENGTEAAAATAVVVGTTSLPPTPLVFRADRPFLFFIVDKKTGTIVFAGRLIDPKP